jgi:hypothetical protein
MSEPDKTLAEFLAQKRFSKAYYYSLKQRGLAPNETLYPGRVIRISAEAEQAWEEKIAAHAASKAAKLEVARRREIATAAGKAAAKSPLHVSKRKAGKHG